MREGAAAGDDARERLAVCTGVEERAVIGDVAGVIAAAEEAGGRDLDGSGVDRGVASVGVIGIDLIGIYFRWFIIPLNGFNRTVMDGYGGTPLHERRLYYLKRPSIPNIS